MPTLVPAPVKVGLIGGGGIANAHIKGYQRFSDLITITAVADAVEETARRRGDFTSTASATAVIVIKIEKPLVAPAWALAMPPSSRRGG